MAVCARYRAYLYVNVLGDCSIMSSPDWMHDTRTNSAVATP